MIALRAFGIVAFLMCSTLAEARIVLGPGGSSCGTWARDRQQNQAGSQLNQAWVLGYVTAYGIHKPQEDSLPKAMDSRTMMNWIDNFCDANPDKDIADAAKALIEELTGRVGQ